MTRLKAGLAVLTVTALTAGGFLWLRDSQLVEVRDIQITGITASDGEKVRAALEGAAKDMTTLNVREEALRDAVARFSSVDDLRVRADFPHTLRIAVIERRPVAALARPGERRLPVTSNGTMLRGVTAERDLPSVALRRMPAGPRVTDRRVLEALAVAGAAPGPLRSRSDAVRVDRRGVVVALRHGPELVFGDKAEAARKWAAAARVLAEVSSQGATYLDLRIPGRVAAGGLAPIATPTPDPNVQPEAENSLTLDP